MKRPVAITWGLLLAGGYAVALPAVASLLKQSLDAARQIERYTASILEHAAGIERNTAQAVALKETRAVAPKLLSAAGSLQEHTENIAATLRADGGAAAPGQEVGP